ncbi:MAG: glycosyltransferase family 4 protein [Solirubrobacterales bacterium]|nr:glycosyltransferase family 4 protein [Solirubrobacterales bacterium]
MRINIVITGFRATRTTAGHEVLFEYANRLIERGHDVAIITTSPSESPRWFDLKARLIQPPKSAPVRAGVRTALRYGAHRLGAGSKRSVKEALSGVCAGVAPSAAALPYRRAAALERFARAVPPADVTLASGALTALPVYLYGTGVRAYFMQHYETYFTTEENLEWQRLYELEAELSYKLPLHRIANSSWLAQHVRERHGGEVQLCVNGFDHQRFFPEGSPTEAPLTVVSYSGRKARWKGFPEAAEAMRLVRERLGEVRWRVFGDEALLPPDNPIAPYESIGVVDAPAIRRLYSEAHIALCPAWYESFAMYPIEAMACGCAVVSTEFGVEDYARHERNALIARARDPQAMADAVVRLARDTALRGRMIAQARRDIQAFSWERSADRMDELLGTLVAGDRAADSWPAAGLGCGSPGGTTIPLSRAVF